MRVTSGSSHYTLINIGGNMLDFAANININAASSDNNAAYFSRGVDMESSGGGHGKLKTWALKSWTKQV